MMSEGEVIEACRTNERDEKCTQKTLKIKDIG
jgi:hypothetical protein